MRKEISKNSAVGNQSQVITETIRFCLAFVIFVRVARPSRRENLSSRHIADYHAADPRLSHSILTT